MLTAFLKANDVKKPAFDIAIGGRQVTALNDRLINLSLTDNRGFEADTLELTIDDADGKIALPPRGVQVSVAFGWQGESLVHKGLFTVDEVSHSGPPDQIVITARSADFRQDFNVKREYSWHDITVGSVVQAIAGRYGLTPAISRPLLNIEIDHADQTNESDISFLSRMADMLGAIATIKNGNLLFIIPNRGMSQSGQPFPEIEITRSSGDKHSFRVADREAYTGVKACWLDLQHGTRPNTEVACNKAPTEDNDKSEREYLEGAEGNVFVMRQIFKTEQIAKRAAAAKWSALQRGAAEFSITLSEGRAELYPELSVAVKGFKPVVDNQSWIIAKVAHQISEKGFLTQLDLELKINNNNMISEEG